MSNTNQSSTSPSPQQYVEEIIPISDTISLHSADVKFAQALYQLIIDNKPGLQESMDWPRSVQSVEDTRRTLLANSLLHHRNYSKMFIITCQQQPIGVFSFNLIEPANKTAYIGYWLSRENQGKGIISAVLNTVIDYYTRQGMIRRFVIKCITTNLASNRVALRNGFSLEGCLRQAEYLNGEYYDQNIYAKIVNDTE